MLSSIHNLFAATKAVLADKEHLQHDAENEAKAAQQDSASTISVIVEKPPQYSLGEVVYSASALSGPCLITSLLYYQGSVILTTSKGGVAVLNAITFAVEGSAAITGPTSGRPLPITCACLSDSFLITAHSSGEVFCTPLADLPSLTPVVLTSFPSPITTIASHSSLLHAATHSGDFHSFHLTSRHLVHSLTLSSSPLTAVLAESANVVWVGDSRGCVRRLALAERALSSLKVAEGGEGGGLQIRCLASSPSPLPKKVKKAAVAKKGKGGGAAKEEEPVEEEKEEVGGPILLWCAYGPGCIKVWDTREGRNSLVLEYQHVPEDALNALRSSLSLSSAPSLLSPTSSSSFTGFAQSPPHRPSVLSSALPAPSSSGHSIIHSLLLHSGTLYTAHEERALGVLPVSIQATATGATRTLPPHSNGSDLVTVQQPPFKDAVTRLLLVPANPFKPEPKAENASVTDSPPEAAPPEDADADEAAQAAKPPSEAASTAASPSLPGGSAFHASPYLLASTSTGEVHIFSVAALAGEVEERRLAESRRLEALMEAWMEAKTKGGGKGKARGAPAVGEGKARSKGKKEKAETAREEQKEMDSDAGTTADSATQ